MCNFGIHGHGVDGFTVDMFVDCVLHTVDMGVAGRFVAEGMVAALKANVYSLPDTTQVARMTKGCMKMKQELKPYYRQKDIEQFADGKCTRIKNLNLKRFGKTLRTPFLKAKGAETRGVIEFTVGLLDRLGAHAPHKCRMLAQAGRHLLRWYEICKAEKRTMSIGCRIELFSEAINHVVLYKASGSHMVYKHHAFLHLTALACFHGNPSYFSTYEDESENGLIAKIAEAVHARTFAMSTFERLHLADRLDRARVPNVVG